MENEYLKLTCVLTEKVDPIPLEKNIKQLLVKGEKIMDAYKSPLYFVALTNKRLVAREQNPDHSKILTHAIPYRSIDSYSIIYDKLLGFTHTLEIRTSTLSVILNFKIDVDINAIINILNEAVL